MGAIRLSEKTHITRSQRPRGEREFLAPDSSQRNIGLTIARSAFSIGRARNRNSETLLGAQADGSRREDFVVGVRNNHKNVARALIHLCRERRSFSAVSISKGDWRSAASAAVRDGVGCSSSSIAAFAQ